RRSALERVIGPSGGAASGQALDEEGHALAAADAHRLEADRRVRSAQPVDQGREQAGPGHAEGVTQRDRTAMYVQPLGIHPQLPVARHDLSGERLVELDKVDVVDRHPSARREASTGPRPMISGDSALTPVETSRAIGVMPSARARVSLITTTAAAPSLRGQALPAVT